MSADLRNEKKGNIKMKSLRSFITVIVILSSALILTACAGKDDSDDDNGINSNITLTSITVTPANPYVVVGATQQFAATGTYSDNSTQDITSSVAWSSSNTGTATINASGLAVLVAARTTTITATSGSVSGTTTITITSVINLPKTGQTACYDEEGSVIACSSTGQDGEIKAGIAWPIPRFIVGTGAEVDCVTDNLTGLMWVKSPDSVSKTWADALTYANGLSLCGYDDWRLPNIKELISLIDRSMFNPVLPAGHPFSNVPNGYFWSSTTLADPDGGTEFAWYVDIMTGDDFTRYKTDNYIGYVWPVRSGQGVAQVDLSETGQTTCYDTAGSVIACSSTGQDGDIKAGVAWPIPRFIVGTGAEADCVTDNLTGLMWVTSPDSTLRTWANALTYANGLSLCGYGDWRLPNVIEFESLINAGEQNTAAWLNTQGFSNVQECEFYWSSTSYAGNPGYARSVDMWNGVVFYNSKDSSNYVWPVRAGQ